MIGLRGPVFVQLVVATPVVDEDNWIAVHARRVAAAPANVSDAVCSLFWGEPHAGLATHSVGAVHPGIAVFNGSGDSFVHGGSDVD